MKRLGGFGRVNLDTASAGDIVSIAGVGGASVTVRAASLTRRCLPLPPLLVISVFQWARSLIHRSPPAPAPLASQQQQKQRQDTLCGLEVAEPLQTQAIDPPTLTMTFGVNDSPLAGRDGTHLTGTKIGSRLLAEAETNVSIRVMQQAGGGDSFEVQGRGELQLGVLIENMRREGTCTRAHASFRPAPPLSCVFRLLLPLRGRTGSPVMMTPPRWPQPHCTHPPTPNPQGSSSACPLPRCSSARTTTAARLSPLRR